jgi:hypothetical protein
VLRWLESKNSIAENERGKRDWLAPRNHCAFVPLSTSCDLSRVHELLTEGQALTRTSQPLSKQPFVSSQPSVQCQWSR